MSPPQQGENSPSPAFCSIQAPKDWVPPPTLVGKASLQSSPIKILMPSRISLPDTPRNTSPSPLARLSLVSPAQRASLHGDFFC